MSSNCLDLSLITLLRIIGCPVLMARLAKGISPTRGPGSGWKALVTFDLLVKVIYWISGSGLSMIWGHATSAWYPTSPCLCLLGVNAPTNTFFEKLILLKGLSSVHWHHRKPGLRGRHAGPGFWLPVHKYQCTDSHRGQFRQLTVFHFKIGCSCSLLFN